MCPVKPTARATEDRGAEAYLDLLTELTREYASATDLDAVHLQALERIRDTMNVAGSSLFLLENDNSELVCKACIGAIDITGMRLPSDAGIAGRTIQTNRAQIVNDVQSDPDFFTNTDAQTGFTTQALLYSPLSIGDQVMGAIGVVNPLNNAAGFDPNSAELLTTLANAAAMALKNAEMTRELLARERVRQELTLAAEVQRRLLPDCSNLPANIYGLSYAAREMSGDFFDVVTLDDGRLYFAVGDVSGKGLNAALLMVKTTTLFRLLARSVPSPGTLLPILNRELCDTISAGMFVTLTAGTYDPATGRLCLSSAGHMPSLLRNARGQFRRLSAAMPPLGIVNDHEEAPYPQDDILLCTGELYLYSDGVTEGWTNEGRELELDGFCSMLDDLADRPLRDRLEAVVTNLRENGGKLRDDVTLLGIETPSDKGATLPLHFRLTALPDRLALLRDLLRHALIPLTCAAETKDEIVLAVDEACQNIIRHAYAGQGEGEIEGRISLDGQRLRIELRDQAPRVSGEACQPVSGARSDSLQPGGLGNALIHGIMDKVYFEDNHQERGNCLVLEKELTAQDCG